MTDKPKRLLVMLSGWAGSGKDAAATLMVEEMAFQRLAFADALKKDAAQVTGLPLVLFHSPSLKNEPLGTTVHPYTTAETPRDVLLQHGAQARAADPDIYTRTVVKCIHDLNLPRVVISDWRMLHEYNFITRALPDYRIITARIFRDSVSPRPESIEHELDEFTFNVTLYNNGSTSDLRDMLHHSFHTALKGVPAKIW